jgi:hypothetical protein
MRECLGGRWKTVKIQHTKCQDVTGNPKKEKGKKRIDLLFPCPGPTLGALRRSDVFGPVGKKCFHERFGELNWTELGLSEMH